MATTIEHSVLTTTELHEPKGIAAATADYVYLADGTGSGDWERANPHGGIRYTDLTTGTTFTTPTTDTLVNVATAVTHAADFTTNDLGRLTYTGTPARHIHAVMDFTVKHSSGGGNDMFFQIYKNGSPFDAEIAVSADSSTFMQVPIHFDNVVATNDYFELYCKAASGNIVVYQLYSFIMGMPG